MKNAGIYILNDKFFEDINEPFLKNNKNGNRPHYYCIKDDNLENIYWFIPLSSRIEKYETIKSKIEEKNKRCDIIHITKLANDKKSVFLIQDIFPVTDEYIDREYTILGNHLILNREKEIKIIEKKARRTLKLLKQGIKFTKTQVNIIKILEKLKEKDLNFDNIELYFD